MKQRSMANYKSSKLRELLNGNQLSGPEGIDKFLKDIDDHLSLLERSSAVASDKLDRLNVIFELIPNTISWIGKDLKYISVNRALAKTCNMDPMDFVGQPVGFHTKESFFYDFCEALFASSQKTVYHHLDVNVGGQDKSYLISGTKLEDGEKAVVIGVDITELKQLQSQLSLTEKLATLGEMIAGILHDINNPLMLIEGSVHRLQKRIKDQEQLDILKKILFASEKITKIASGVKIFVRNDADEEYVSEPLQAIIDDAVVICQPKLKKHDVQIEVDPKIASISVICNYTQIFQVFVNLISNAIDAIEHLPERWIKIHLAAVDSLVKIHFVDSGKGIPTEAKSKIFTAFFTTKRRGVGSGLGLSLCRKILEAHQGGIHILEEAPNTTFEITIPKKVKAP